MGIFAALLGLSLSFLLGVVDPPVAGVTGRVVNEAGAPVIGAEVVLSVPDSQEDLRRSAVSGPQGRFKLPPVPSGRFLLTVTHPAHADLHVHDVEIPAGRAAVDLGSVTLAAGGVLEGTVTGAGGKPIEGAEVRIIPEIRTPGPSGEDLKLNVKTGPDGIFRARGLRRGERFAIAARHPGYIPAILEEVPVPPQVPVRIELKPLRRLSGQVVGSKGDPIAGAVVTCKADYFDEVRGQTDAEGRFRLDGLPSGSLGVKASADGYLDSSTHSLKIPQGKDLEDVEITLQQAHVLDVRVVDARGEPAAGVTVTAKSDDEVPQSVEGATDSGGRRRLHVDPAKSYRVGTGLSAWDLIMCDAQASASQQVHVPPGTGETQVELRLPVSSKGIEVSGRVLGEDGAGLPGIRVSINTEPPPRICYATETEADGSFLFTHARGGTYTLEASRSVWETAAKVEIQVAGQPVRDVELRLGPEEKGATISGRILGVAPADLPRTRIMFQDSEGVYFFGKIDLRGTYRMHGIPPGEWSLMVMAPHGGAFESVWISPGQTEFNLDLEVKEYLTLSGRVLLDGEPLAGAQLEILKREGDDADDYGVETAYDGTFRLRLKEPGPLTIKFSGDPAGPGAGTVRTLYFTESQEILIELSTEPD